MLKHTHIDYLVEGPRVLGGEPTQDDVNQLAEQIEAEGITIPFFVYRDGENYVVVDDVLRLRALQHLCANDRWPQAYNHGQVPAYIHASSDVAVFQACDGVVRRQLSPVAETIYIQDLVKLYEIAGPKDLGGRVRSDGRTKPTNQQPGATGMLAARYKWSDEWARQAVLRTYIPRTLLQDWLSYANVSKEALARAGQAVKKAPERDPEDVARECIEGTPTSRSARTNKAADTSQTILAGATGDNDRPAGDEAAPKTGDAPTSQEPGRIENTRQVGGNSVSDILSRARQIVAQVTDLPTADRLALFEKVFQVLKEHDPASATLWHQLEAQCCEPAETDPEPAGNETPVQDAATPANDEPATSPAPCAEWQTGPLSEAADERTPDPSTNGPMSGSMISGTARWRPGTSGAPVGQDGRKQPNSSRGQSNDGLRGGVCPETQAERGREIVAALKEQLGSLSNVSTEVEVGLGSLSRLQAGNSISARNMNKIQRIGEIYGV